MYHVIGTSITATLLYLISFFLYRSGFYTLKFHRRIWNFLLAAAFLFAAAAGIFLALQVSYKWEIPFVKPLLRWHVEAGIVLAVTGIFHFFWHITYFAQNKGSESSEEKEIIQFPLGDIRFNLILVGFVSSSVQLLLMREIMNITGGYELISGTFLASWLIASSAGSYIAGRSSLDDLRAINLTFTLSPLSSLLLMLVTGRLLLHPGQAPSFLVSFIFTLIVLIPFCLVSGFTFVRLIKIAKESGRFMPGESFSVETAGGIAAGLIIPLLTSGMINTYQLLLIIVLLANVRTLTIYVLKKPWWMNLIRVGAAVIAILVIIFNVDICFRQLLLPGIKVTDTHDSPYGNITSGEYRGETSIYYNHRLLTYSNDVVEREENVHYAMLQCESPGEVLLISGSQGSHIAEIQKYQVKRITCVERDPALSVMTSIDHDTLAADVIISDDDAFSYIRKNDSRFDVILMLLPPPSTLLLSRYYTTGFFTEAKNRMNPAGVFLCSPGPADSYLNNESVALYSSVRKSLRSVFKNVLIIPGQKLYFVASDKPLTTAIGALAAGKHITNMYVNQDYISDDLLNSRSREIEELMDDSVKENTASYPVASFIFQAYNLSRSGSEKAPSIVLLGIIFAMPLLSIKRRNLPMYTGALALAGFEIILLFILQLTAGNMYQITGLVIAGLMTGLATGAGTVILDWVRMTGMKMVMLTGFYLFMGLVFPFLLKIRGDVVATLIIMITGFIPGVITGSIFRQMTNEKENASEIYTADLAGSAIGFITVTGLVMPLAGIRVSIFLLGALIFAGLLFGTIGNNK